MNTRVFDEWGEPGLAIDAGSAGVSLLRAVLSSEYDATTGKLAVRLSDAELGERRDGRTLRKADDHTEARLKDAHKLGPAGGGALTHPGRAGETHCYADI